MKLWLSGLSNMSLARRACALVLLCLLTTVLVFASSESFALAWRLLCLCPAVLLGSGIVLSLVDDDQRLRQLLGLTQTVFPQIASDDRKGQGTLSTLERHLGNLETQWGAFEQRIHNRHSLSGLPTREPLLELIGEALDTDRSGLLGIIHLLDLERLDAFDDHLSEQLLVTLVRRVRGMLDPAYFLAHVDRARLAIWYSSRISPQTARSQLDAIGYALAGPVEIDGRELMPEITVSSAEAPRDAVTPSTLIARAVIGDRGAALAPLDEEGQDRSELARERYALEQDLRRAVERGELELHYQPLVDAGKQRICGAEALLRWHHPIRGMLPPARFIPLMESASLAGEIGLWVLNSACRQAREWQRDGLNLKIAVNISARQLDGDDLATLVERTLKRHSLASSALEIELTETVAAADDDRTVALFTALRQLGVSTAIDDFGTGYSSLKALRALSFDKIKIDREFVTAVDQRHDSQAICRSILALGDGLGIHVLAEGVERYEEYAWLRAQGCQHFQGFYFACPLDAGAFRTLVSDKNGLARPLRRKAESNHLQGQN